ncbi:aldehyde-activating protein [Leptolyngbya valderiana BDU 20041]|nr:GFA family protein [Geitlerinema sp. CS-897]OAB62966.1 aldehyde-activating protein [Leptolyngbya valderiana BDU 20041]PPT06495.1 Gfa-like protein [Geitlerinema sp. FC II]
MTKVYEGGCHCGAVRFRIEVDDLKAIDCNCSICTKKGFLHLIVPPERFTLLKGEDALTTYQFNTGVAKHLFCKTCGIHPFYRPRSHPDCYDVNLRCLDGDVLAEFAIEPFDGKHWEENVAKIQNT